MKKETKQGFTLVELLVTIAILAVILVIGIVVVSNTVDNVKEKSTTINKNAVLAAATDFANEFDKKIKWRSNSEETMACISVEEVIEQGFLNKQEVGNGYQDYSVKITKSKDLVNDYALLKNTECKIKDTKAPEIRFEDVTIEIKENYDIKTGVEFDGTGSNIVREEITLNGQTIANTKDLDLGKYEVVYKVEDESGNTAEKTRNINIVDTKVPVINPLTQNPNSQINNWISNDIQLSATATDNGSGIIAYQFSQSLQPTNNWINLDKSETTITKTQKVNTKGKWYFHVKDVANNVGSKEINLYIDKIGPSFVSSNGSLSYNTIPTTTFNDSESGVKEVRYYVSTSSTAPEATNSSFTTNTSISMACSTNYYAWAVAVDNAGNFSEVKSLNSYYRSCSSGSSSSSSNKGSSSSSGSSCGTTCQMQKNSEAWHNATTQSEKDALHAANVELGKQIGLSENGNYNSSSGQWTNNSGKPLYTVSNSNKTSSSSTSSSSSKTSSSSSSSKNKSSSSSKTSGSSSSSGSKSFSSTVSKIVSKITGKKK